MLHFKILWSYRLIFSRLTYVPTHIKVYFFDTVFVVVVKSSNYICFLDQENDLCEVDSVDADYYSFIVLFLGLHLLLGRFLLQEVTWFWRGLMLGLY